MKEFVFFGSGAETEHFVRTCFFLMSMAAVAAPTEPANSIIGVVSEIVGEGETVGGGDELGDSETVGDGDRFGEGAPIVGAEMLNGAISGYLSTTLGLALIRYSVSPIPELSISVALGYLLA